MKLSHFPRREAAAVGLTAGRGASIHPGRGTGLLAGLPDGESAVADGSLGADLAANASQWPRIVFAVGLAALWVVSLAHLLAHRKLFGGGTGGDYVSYFAQSYALRIGDTANIYHPEALVKYSSLLLPFTNHPNEPYFLGPVAYPPLFAWLLEPFTIPWPPIGLALWSGLNFLAALYLGYRASRFFPAPQRWWIAFLVVSAFPTIDSIMWGQPMILLACALGEFYLALRAGRDFRAGLWLSCLLFKPEYGILIGPLLIWKRRWRSVIAVALGAVVVVGGSALVSGIPALLTYPASLADQSGFKGTNSTTNPLAMINWRSLVLFVDPSIDDRLGVALVVLLGLATVALLVPGWRHQWQPEAPDFSIKLTLVVLATLLVNYHSHAHGAVLLAVPLAAALAEGHLSARSRRLVDVTVVAVTMVFLASAALWQPGHLFTLLLLACFGSLLVDSWRLGRSTARSTAVPASVPNGVS